MTSPLHISGPYRAGTTATALYVGNHPIYQPTGPALHTTNWPRERHEWWGDAAAYACDRWGFDESRVTERVKGMGRPSPPHGHEAGNWGYAMRALGFGAPWLEKTNLELGFTDTFLDWFPDGKVLAVLRDPRSILASFREYDYRPTEDRIYLQAAFVALHAMQHVLSHDAKRPDADPDARYAFVRYENLAQHPEPTLRAVVRWLGLDWPGRDVMLSTDGWQDIPGVAWQDRSSFADPEDIDTDRAVHRWRGNLSGEELGFCEWVCWDEMQRFGYDPAHTVRPYPLQFTDLMQPVWHQDRTRAMLRRWLETGEGTEAFPEDPSDEATWRESNRESVA